MQTQKQTDEAIDTTGEEALAEMGSKIKSGELASSQSSAEGVENVVQFYHSGNAATLVISNHGTTPATTSYIIHVLDGDDNRWKLHTQGAATVQPNTVYRQGFHKWRAADWRAQWS
jgi:hypothetical protein